jgi:Ca-activated chloride channel family protein
MTMPSTASRVALPGDAMPSPLAGLGIEVHVTGAMSEFRIEQCFRNAEAVPIEAVYSFPLPADAVLLDIAVDIGGRRLRGDVVKLSDARLTYEEAMGDGDGAFLLEQIQPGIFTLNAGNLRPGETARIAFAFASLNRWSGDRLRLVMPTTIAPRYGRWPVAPHAAPVISLSAENRFALRVAIGEDLRAAALSCPSHRLRRVMEAGAPSLALEDGTAAMDRDIVLEIRHREERPSFALLGHGVGGTVALASFQPSVPGDGPSAPVDAVAVIDCSGSMAGTSIAQARQAMHAVLAGLGRRDRLGMIAFGSSCRTLDGGRHAATPAGLAKLGDFVVTLDADLGGTEIRAALDAAVAMATRRGGKADIFLVTDGEVADWTATVSRMRDAGLRVFAVGVGHSPAEPFLSALAAATGGAAEFVTPDEAMAGRIARHFGRMRAPRATDIAIVWPDSATALGPATPTAIFDGDTIHAYGMFPAGDAGGHAVLEFSTADGARHRQAVALAGTVAAGTGGLPATVARLAAAACLATLPADAATSLAIAHRLICPGTAWVVVDIRATTERTDGMPALRHAPHMLAADWGGTGTAMPCGSVMLGWLTESDPPYMLDRLVPDLPDPPAPRATPATPRARQPGPGRRHLAAIRQAVAGGRPAPGMIAHAAGLADELDDLLRGQPDRFQSDLICAAFEVAILDAIATDDDDMKAARDALRQQVRAAIGRLRGIDMRTMAVFCVTRAQAAVRAIWPACHADPAP